MIKWFRCLFRGRWPSRPRTGEGATEEGVSWTDKTSIVTKVGVGRPDVVVVRTLQTSIVTELGVSETDTKVM